jgi:hypothetical protein
MADKPGQPEKTKSAPDTGTNIILGAALVIITVYFAVLLFMMARQLELTDPMWDRATYLLGGFEAIAFTATGYLFGREVNRKRAEKAEERIDDAQDRAVDAEKKASEEKTKGKALAEAIKAKAARAERSGAGASALEALGPSEQATVAQADVQELAQLADQLFP